MIKIKTILLTIFLLAIVSAPVWAQSPTATPSGQDDSKIKDIRDAVKEKVKEQIDKIKQGKPKAYAGKITEVGEASITLNTQSGEKQVLISDQTKIFDKNKKEITLAQLKVGDFVIAMGFPTDNALDGRRIVVSPQPKISQKEAVFGRVTDISEENILTIKNEKKNITYMVETDSKTVITKKVNNNVAKVNFEMIKLDDRVVAVGTVTENEEKIITAKLIHVIPGLALGEEKPAVTVTPTPKPKATSTPKASPSPTE